MLANILLVLAALFLFGLLNVTASPMPGGDRGVGYAWMMILCGAGFFVFTGLLAWNLGANHCFDWLGERRNWLVFVGWLAFAVGTLASAAFKTEWHEGEFPPFLRWLAHSQAAFWLPLLLLVPAIWLSNFGKGSGAEVPAFIQIPMKTGFAVSVLMLAGLLFGYFRASSQQAADRQSYHNERDDKQHKLNLEQIAAQKPDDPILNILALTGRFHDADVRESAVANVKSHPHWEAELIRLLNETEWQSEVYQFIDGNEVEHPEQFVEPIKNGLRRTAAEIKRRIKNANDLQEWHFENFSIERCLRAIDEQFSAIPGADFRPAVLELQAALNTPKPERFANVKFTLTRLVDDWLKKH